MNWPIIIIVTNNTHFVCVMYGMFVVFVTAHVLQIARFEGAAGWGGAGCVAHVFQFWGWG